MIELKPLPPPPKDMLGDLLSQGLGTDPDGPADAAYKSALLDAFGREIKTLAFLHDRDMTEYESALGRLRASWLGPDAGSLTRSDAAYRISFLRFAVKSAIQDGG